MLSNVRVSASVSLFLAGFSLLSQPYWNCVWAKPLSLSERVVAFDPPAQPSLKPEKKSEDAEDQDEAVSEEDGKARSEITADQLNAQQTIEQTFTVTRKINGEVVEVKKVVAPNIDGSPVFETEAGGSIADLVEAQVDREVLTRREILAEADIEFTLIDKNNDQQLVLDEFLSLLSVRREDPNYQAFIVDENDEAYEALEKGFKDKFSFFVGMGTMLSRRAYIVEVLRDFDSMDVNGDYILRDRELKNFRLISVGYSVQ